MMRKALIVGIDNYLECPLSGCVKDAQLMAKVLSTHDNGDRNFDVMLCENVKHRNELRKQIRDLFTQGHGDVALLYFSGHGCVVGHDGYIVTPDYEEGDEGISLSEILKIANESVDHYSNRVIILDCCYSGDICKTNPDSSGAPNIASGVTLLAACDKDECAVEVDGCGGEFTSLIVFGLQGAAADICGAVTPSGLYACVDCYFGAWQQRPVFATNVKQRVTLRKTCSIIEKDVLRKMREYFATEDVYRLDPSYEFTNDPTVQHEYVQPYAVAGKVAILKDLQKMERAGLVVPCGEKHMYFAAMHSKSCCLTESGKYMRNLALNDRI